MDRVGLVIVTHGTAPPSETLDKLSFHGNQSEMMETSGAFQELSKKAVALIRQLLDKGFVVDVVASGGKRNWKDPLGVGDVLLREIVRGISMEEIVSLSGTVQVEGASKDVYEAAKMSMSKLSRRNISQLTVLCADPQAAEAFRHLKPKIDVSLVAPECVASCS